MRLIKERTDPEYMIPDNELFFAQTSSEAVTSEPELKIWENWRIYDTPGYNDPKRDDLDTLKKSFDFLEHNSAEVTGISGVVNVIQWPEGGRVTTSTVEILMRYLSTFTLSYPNYDLESLEKGYFPKIFILFTRISPYQTSKKNPLKKKVGDNVIKHSDLIKDQRKWIRTIMCHMMEKDNVLVQNAF